MAKNGKVTDLVTACPSSWKPQLLQAKDSYSLSGNFRPVIWKPQLLQSEDSDEVVSNHPILNVPAMRLQAKDRSPKVGMPQLLEASTDEAIYHIKGG
jgi:hypothetical protein